MLEDVPDYHQIKRQLGNVPVVWINVGLARVELNACIQWWRILLALSELEMKRGNASEAARLRAPARGIVQYIAAHTPPDLREAFLQTPELLYVLERT